MAKNNLVPTPVVDKNGRATTVYKSAAGEASSSSLSKAAPVVSAGPAPLSLLNVPPLSSGEVTDFLAFYPETRAGTHGMFRSLSGVTQAMIWRARQNELINDTSVTVLLSAAQDDIKYGYQEHDTAESIIRSTILVVEAIADERIVVPDPQWINGVRQVVIGSGYRGVDASSLPPEMSTVEEVLPVAGIAAYALALKKHYRPGSQNSYLEPCEYAYGKQRFFGTMIPNPVLQGFVKQHPETGYALGKFVAERDLGISKADAQAAIDYLSETSETKAISDGWL